MNQANEFELDPNEVERHPAAPTEITKPDPEYLAVCEQLQADIEAADRNKMDWLPNWYLGLLADIDHRRELIKQMAAEMQRELDRRESALAWKFGQQFKQQVLEDLAKQKGKTKSVKYLLGKAGLRTIADKMVVRDEQAVLEWARKNCPEAVKIVESLLITPLKKLLEDTGELAPGCEIHEGYEKFYPEVEPARLRMTDPRPLMPYKDV